MYQGGAVGGGGGDRIVVGPHVLVPVRPHGHVGGAELPQLGGLVEAGAMKRRFCSAFETWRENLTIFVPFRSRWRSKALMPS